MSTDATHSAVPPDGEPPTVSAPAGSERGTVSRDAARAGETLQRDPSASSTAIDAPPGFVIEREIGVGGMGVVFLARQLGLNRPVALKLVKGGQAVNAKALIRFLAEAEAVAAVKHPNVVEVYQYGDHHGKPYLALEFCPGGDLTALVHREAKTSEPRDLAWFRRIAELMAKVAEGVNAAHALGIVHRDLKPANVFLTADGTPKVADFGLAKRGIGSDLTNTQAVMGTPAYMAPEQAGGGTKFVGPEADVWALGVMLYELASGQRPIDTSGPLMDALARVANGTVSPLRIQAPTVPTDLALIAHKCLNADPRDRYPNAGGLATDLRNWLDGKPISARPAGVIEQAVKWAKRNKKLAGMGLAVFATMATATGVSLGFGLYAGEQRQEAERAVQREADEKRAAVAARTETQRMLAKALMAPIAPAGPTTPLNAYERNALWELAGVRDEQVPLMLFDAAGQTEQTAAQFRSRAVHLDQAAVRLDARRRREADSLMASRLADASLPLAIRRDLAMAAVATERFGAADAAADALLQALLVTADLEDLNSLSHAISAACQRLPATRATELCQKAVAALHAVAARRKVEEDRIPLARALSAVCRALPADHAVEVLTKALDEEPGGVGRGELTVGLSDACERLPPGRSAEALTAALHRAQGGRERWILAIRLTAVCRRLPADRSAHWCGEASRLLLSGVWTADGALDRFHYASGLSEVCERLPADRAAETCGKAADILLKALARKEVTVEDCCWLAEGIAAVTAHLPADRAIEVCEPVAGRLLKSLAYPPGWDQSASLAEGLCAVCGRLPADRANGVRGAAADTLLAVLARRPEGLMLTRSASGLATLCRHLSGPRATPTCEKAADAILTALSNTREGYTTQELAGSLAVVCQRAATRRLAESLSGVLANERNKYPRRALASALSSACERLPADPAIELLVASLGRAADDEETQELARGLMAACEQLPVGRAAEVCVRAAEDLLPVRGPTLTGGTVSAAALAAGLMGLSERGHFRFAHRDELAVLTGPTAFHAAGLPNPRPLPPQTLVELLKHPFCVREARRAVLDALEFTYDRQLADLWEFVAFAEKEHPELDLLTPPKRPTR